MPIDKIPEDRARGVMVERLSSLSLGRRVRDARMARGMLGKELAEASHVSASLISQIEHDRTTPSLDVLNRIANALGVGMGTFFVESQAELDLDDAERSGYCVIGGDSRNKLQLHRSRVSLELLTPRRSRLLEVVWLELAPGESTYPSPSAHGRGEECALVIQGVAEFEIENTKVRVGQFDSITLDSTIPHRATCVSSDPAIIVWAVAPPLLFTL